jgi:hypothetical protein
MRYFLLALSSLFLLLGVWLTTAHTAPPRQDVMAVTPLATALPPQTCEGRIQQSYVAASDACLSAPEGYACNGGAAPVAAPAGPGNALGSLGAVIGVDDLDQITTQGFTPEGTDGGLVWLRADQVGMSVFLSGAVTITNQITPGQDFPKWTALTVVSGASPAGCSNQPPDAVIIQNTDLTQTVRFVINGVSIDLSGTMMVYTEGAQTVFVELEGLSRVLAFGVGVTIVAGQETRVNFNGVDWTFPLDAPLPAVPYTPGITDNVAIELLDRAVTLPQPGFVATDGAVNLRTGPSTQFGIVLEVPAGQTMTILGRNEIGDWYHVRLGNGVTGWMFAELLRRNHGAIQAVYESTPTPPQRFGEAGRAAFVNTQLATLRTAPDNNFGAILNLNTGDRLELLARSPYSPWVKVQTEAQTVGWVPLLNVETEAILESLPVDFEVPQPPTPPPPTPVPGLTGFAFPDPACFPDC